MKKPIPEGSKIAFLGYAVYEGLDRVVNKYVSDYFHCINLNIFFEVVSREFDDGSIYINYNDKEYKINRRQVVKVKRKKAKPVSREFWIKCVPNKEYELIGIVDALDEKRYPHTIKVREILNEDDK